MIISEQRKLIGKLIEASNKLDNRSQADYILINSEKIFYGVRIKRERIKC